MPSPLNGLTIPAESPASIRPLPYSGPRLKPIGSAAPRTGPTWLSGVNSHSAGALAIHVANSVL